MAESPGVFRDPCQSLDERRDEAWILWPDINLESPLTPRGEISVNYNRSELDDLRNKVTFNLFQPTVGSLDIH